MGIGYAVSPLHRIDHLDTSAIMSRAPAQGGNSPLKSAADLLGTKVGEGHDRLRSPTVLELVTWRDRLAAKYRDQFDEALTWDEASLLQVSEDVATNGDVMFHYAAAVLDQRGETGLQQVIQDGVSDRTQIHAAFAEASRRAFGGRFPHLLLGATVWLPYRSQLMIEEPNWDGMVARYGSVYHLAEEVTTVRAAIKDAGPLLFDATATQTSVPPIVAAWQASGTILRLATLAGAKHLPLWTTG